MDKRIYEDGEGCLYIATSLSEACELSLSAPNELKEWDDSQMAGSVTSAADLEKYSVMPESWADLVANESVGFLLDPSEFHEID